MYIHIKKQNGQISKTRLTFYTAAHFALRHVQVNNFHTKTSSKIYSYLFSKIAMTCAMGGLL